MENDPRIRPLPPEELQRPPRGWIPLASTATAAIVVIGVLMVSFDGDAEVAAPSTTTSSAAPRPLGGEPPASITTTAGEVAEATPPPTLAEMVPDLGAEMMRISYFQEGGGVATVDWAAISAEPSPRREWPPPSGPGAFDATGSMFAAEPGHGGLMVDHVAVAAGVTSWAWHPEGQELAWIAQPAGSTDYALSRIPHPFADRSEIVEVTRFARRTTLAGWGDWGYLVTVEWEQPDAPGFPWFSMAVVLDADGEPIVAVPGTIIGAGADGIVVVATDREALDTALETGLTIEELRSGGAPLLDEGRHDVVVLGPDRELIADFDPSGRDAAYLADDASLLLLTAISPSTRAARIETRVLDSTAGSVRRVTSVSNVDRMIGLSDDDRWLLMSSPSEIVLHDWERNITHRIPFDLGEVIDVHL